MKDAERTNRDTPAALDAIPERYWRNARFLSRTDQEKLLQAHVVIIGLGGLGGTVLEELLRLGIGTITGVDMDVFELSNLNRSSSLRKKISAFIRRKRPVYVPGKSIRASASSL